jgi:large subunit ribosomal protein L2
MVLVTREYDSNQNAYIYLIHFGDGDRKCMLHPRGAIIGDTIVFWFMSPILMGSPYL